MLDAHSYPHTWRTAIIIPIPKPNKPSHNAASFRPISLLPCLGKTLEKILARRIMWFIIKNKLISHHQTEFKQQHSTIDSLLHIHHYATDVFLTTNHVTILVTDFERDFDRVGVHTVLEQLSRWAIGYKTFNLVKVFMTKRFIRVRVIVHDFLATAKIQIYYPLPINKYLRIS